jgi:Na+-driven multidrug efflux pump
MKALALPGRGRFDREIAVLAVPALGALLADPLLSLVDTAFVGHLGAALGALGVAVAAFEVVFFASTFLEYGTTARVARAVGADDREGASRAAITALVLAAACGMVAALLLGWGPRRW